MSQFAEKRVLPNELQFAPGLSRAVRYSAKILCPELRVNQGRGFITSATDASVLHAHSYLQDTRDQACSGRQKPRNYHSFKFFSGFE